MPAIETSDDQLEHYTLIEDKNEVVTFIFHVAVFVYGLLGNVMVSCSVFNNKSKRTVTNVAIINLAVANILLCLFILPIAPIYSFVKSWPLGPFTCHLVPCIYRSLFYASTLTLTFIAVHRYLVIVHSFEDAVKRGNWHIIISVIWFVSIIYSLPFQDLDPDLQNNDLENSRDFFCVPQWPSISSRHYFLQFAFVVMVVIPFVIIICCYVAMSITISQMSRCDGATQVVEVRRANRLLIVMVIVFCVCWMPTHINERLINNYVLVHQGISIFSAFKVTHVMAMTYACLHPLFYLWINKITFKQFCRV